MKPFHIADPCHESWDAMRNDGKSRFCASCDKRVFDLNALTEKQIAGLVVASSGRFCGRQVVRGGELNVRPEPVPARKPSGILWPIRVAAVAGAMNLAACGSSTLAGEVGLPPQVVETSRTFGESVPKSPVGETTNTSAPEAPPRPEHRPKTGMVAMPEIELAGDIAYVPTLPRAIEFERGKARLTAEGRNLIAAAADFLTSQPETLTIEIAGHISADEIGPRIVKVGHKLALARAEAVRKELIRVGIKASRLKIAVRGADQPLYPNDTEAGRAHNRRADMRICSEVEPCP